MGRTTMDEAEAELASALSRKEPMTKEAALDILSFLVASGRAKRPSSGIGSTRIRPPLEK